MIENLSNAHERSSGTKHVAKWGAAGKIPTREQMLDLSYMGYGGKHTRFGFWWRWLAMRPFTKWGASHLSLAGSNGSLFYPQRSSRLRLPSDRLVSPLRVRPLGTGWAPRTWPDRNRHKRNGDPLFVARLFVHSFTLFLCLSAVLLYFLPGSTSSLTYRCRRSGRTSETPASGRRS